MIAQQPTTRAQIFLSYERNLTESADSSSHVYFGNSENGKELKQPFGGLYWVSEEVLDAKALSIINSEKDTLLLILPVNGGVVVNRPQSEETIIAAGQLYFIPVKNGEHLQVKNPFSHGAVNYIQLRFRTGQSAPAHTATASFDVNKYPACMMRISPAFLEAVALPFIVSIGRFSGREDTVYHLHESSNSVFMIVLSGAFEVQGRLLHEADALVMTGEKSIDAEALSNEALLLFVEMPLAISSI